MKEKQVADGERTEYQKAIAEAGEALMARFGKGHHLIILGGGPADGAQLAGAQYCQLEGHTSDVVAFLVWAHKRMFAIMEEAGTRDPIMTGLQMMMALHGELGKSGIGERETTLDGLGSTGVGEDGTITGGKE
jgi:hypothetical protein